MECTPSNPAKFKADVKEISEKIEKIIREQFDHYMIGHDTELVENKLSCLIDGWLNAPINRCKTCSTELPRHNPPVFCQKCGGSDLTLPKETDWGTSNPA